VIDTAPTKCITIRFRGFEFDILVGFTRHEIKCLKQPKADFQVRLHTDKTLKKMEKALLKDLKLRSNIRKTNPNVSKQDEAADQTALTLLSVCCIKKLPKPALRAILFLKCWKHQVVRYFVHIQIGVAPT